MDIAITLPVNLWNKIASGEKTIELRKNFPKDFDVFTDKVHVILKGTRMIPGYFCISSFERFYAESISDFDPILSKISVPKQWIINYVGYSSAVYLWHIKNVHSYNEMQDRSCLGSMKSNPQSFVYIP